MRRENLIYKLSLVLCKDFIVITQHIPAQIQDKLESIAPAALLLREQIKLGELEILHVIAKPISNNSQKIQLVQTNTDTQQL